MRRRVQGHALAHANRSAKNGGLEDVKQMRSSLVVVLAISCAGCSMTELASQPREKWLPYDRVNVQLRRKLEMRPDQFVLSCRHLVFMGHFETAESLRPDINRERLIITDVTNHYYDNRTGELEATCGYWYCSRNQRYCRASCPPKAWSCRAATE
jgi:hypothetical protein